MRFASTKVFVHAHCRCSAFASRDDRLQHITSRVARDPQTRNRRRLMTIDFDAAAIVDLGAEVSRQVRVPLTT
jgi:hypothetical protein